MSEQVARPSWLPDGYLNVCVAHPLVCQRCGALVDRAFTVEHDRFHTLAPTEEPQA